MSYIKYEWAYDDEDTFEKNGYTLIASIDESEPYEVDRTAIYLTPEGKFAYATASGCSCWEGDWEVTDFDTLHDIEASQLSEDTHMYNPSLKGLKDLLAQAHDYMSRNALQPSL